MGIHTALKWFNFFHIMGLGPSLQAPSGSGPLKTWADPMNFCMGRKHWTLQWVVISVIQTAMTQNDVHCVLISRAVREHFFLNTDTRELCSLPSYHTLATNSGPWAWQLLALNIIITTKVWLHYAQLDSQVHNLGETFQRKFVCNVTN